MNTITTETAEPVTLNPNGLPLPDDPKQRTAITQRLRGHVVSTGWLPEDLGPELDSARDEHLRRLGQAIGAADEVRRLQERWAEEDAAHAEELRDAARKDVGPPADKRTLTTERAVAERTAAERLHAALAVLVEAVDAAVEVLREHEAEWLSDLQDRAGEAQEDRREAARLLEQARRVEWKQHRLAQWLLSAADDAGGFGQQPRPTGAEAPPPAFDGLRAEAFQRPWHQGREWNAGVGAAPEPTANETDAVLELGA